MSQKNDKSGWDFTGSHRDFIINVRYENERGALNLPFIEFAIDERIKLAKAKLTAACILKEDKTVITYLIEVLTHYSMLRNRLGKAFEYPDFPQFPQL